MHKSLRVWATGVVLVSTALAAAPAQAGIGKQVIRSLELMDFRFSGERNFLGDGVTLNTFANWNNRRFDFGNYDLTLTGSMAASAGFTRRGIPEFQFQLNTFQAPVSYTLDFHTGFQDWTASGSFLANVDTRVNALGFYNQVFHISNRGTFETDGFLMRDTQPLDYDIGPITISGNVYVDAVAALTQPFFSASGTENPFAKISGRSQKEIQARSTRDALLSRMSAGEILSDTEMNTLVNNVILSAMLGGRPPDDLFGDLIIPPGLLSADAPMILGDAMIPGVSVQQVPEPAALGLMLLGMGLIPRRRRPASRGT